MRDWIESRFTYVSGASNSETGALDSFVERRGVCRDYAHVMIALARAAHIPARMASVYALRVRPQDFHAVAEVYLDGDRSEEHTSELQSLMRISYAVFCLTQKNTTETLQDDNHN